MVFTLSGLRRLFCDVTCAHPSMDEVQFNIAMREAISLTDHFTLWRKHVQPSRHRRRRLDLLASGSGNGWPDGRRRYPKIYVRKKHGKEISQLISALLDGRAFEGHGVRRDLSNRTVKGLGYSLILISRYPISSTE